MKYISIADYTQINNVSTPKVGVDVIMSKFNNPKNSIKCAQNIGCTFDTGLNVWAVITY